MAAGESINEVGLGDRGDRRGHGGETHQVAGDGRPRLTTQQGVVVGDDQNTLRIGERGPAAMEDFHFREKIFHFDHERIPERVVHARGYGAHGFFENYESLTDLTAADLFERAGERTPAFVRFSTVAGNKGSGDLARDVRGFAVKLYTKAGNWDLVGDLARDVADGLGLQELPDASEPARPPIEDLAPSDALSILKNAPASLAGRKLGVLVCDGADADILDALESAAKQEGVSVAFVAPTISGFDASDGSRRPADEQIDGGPSVLYDAVLVLLSADGVATLAGMPAARDFVTDAYAHAKFIGYGSDATGLFKATGLDADTDAGMIEIADGAAIEPFLARCRELRFWDRPI